MKKLELTSCETLGARKKICVNIIENAARIGNYRIASIPPELLCAGDYQRIPQNSIRRLAENWDDNKGSELLVSYDGIGGYFRVIDGQHRTLAALMTGNPDIKLTCIIYDGMTESQEAVLFALQNENVKPLTPYDIFNANMCITDEDATNPVKVDKIIDRVCRKYGVKVEKGRGVKMLNCLNSCRRIVNQEGESVLRDFFDIYNESAWDMKECAYSTVYFDALSQIYRNYANKWKPVKKRLVDIFAANSPALIVSKARLAYPEVSDKASVPRYICSLLEESANSAKIVA